VFLVALASLGLVHWILGRVPARFRIVDFWALGFITLAFYSQLYSFFPDTTFQRSVAVLLFYLAAFWGVWAYVQEENIIKVMTVQEYELKYGYKFGQEINTRIIQLQYANTADLLAILNQVKSGSGKVIGDEKTRGINAVDLLTSKYMWDILEKIYNQFMKARQII